MKSPPKPSLEGPNDLWKGWLWHTATPGPDPFEWRVTTGTVLPILKEDAEAL